MSLSCQPPSTRMAIAAVVLLGGRCLNSNTRIPFIPGKTLEIIPWDNNFPGGGGVRVCRSWEARQWGEAAPSSALVCTHFRGGMNSVFYYKIESCVPFHSGGVLVSVPVLWGRTWKCVELIRWLGRSFVSVQEDTWQLITITELVVGMRKKSTHPPFHCHFVMSSCGWFGCARQQSRDFWSPEICTQESEDMNQSCVSNFVLSALNGSKLSV